MDSIANLIGNISTGGILGVVGSLGSGILNYFQSKQEHGFKIEEMKLGASLEQVKTAGQLAVNREENAGKAFVASQKADASIQNTSSWVSNLRGATRPLLTWTFCLATFVVIIMSAILPEWLVDAPPLVQFGITMVVDMTAMMISWWFGSRQIEKHMTRWGNTDASASVS